MLNFSLSPDKTCKHYRNFPFSFMSEYAAKSKTFFFMKKNAEKSAALFGLFLQRFHFWTKKRFFSWQHTHARTHIRTHVRTYVRTYELCNFFSWIYVKNNAEKIDNIFLCFFCVKFRFGGKKFISVRGIIRNFRKKDKEKIERVKWEKQKKDRIVRRRKCQWNFGSLIRLDCKFHESVG